MFHLTPLSKSVDMQSAHRGLTQHACSLVGSDVEIGHGHLTRILKHLQRSIWSAH